MMNKMKKEILGKFSLLSDKEKEVVMEAVAYFHYRDNKQHDDGSMGTINISPGELNDLLAYFLRRTKNVFL